MTETLIRRYKRSIPGASPDVEAVQLTEANLWLVFEWADSKPFFGPKPEGAEDKTPHPITGLTVFTPYGRVKAEFGDWIVRRPDRKFDIYPPGEFALLYTPASR